MSRPNFHRAASFAGGFADTNETGTTAANFSAYGLTVFGTTSGAKNYDLNTPTEVGIIKTLFATDASTGAAQTVRASTGGTVNYVSTGGNNHLAAFNNDGAALVLQSLSTTQWLVLSNINCTLSTA